MAVRFNPFKSSKSTGGTWVGPAGAEPFFRGQELVDVTAQEDYRELEKQVVFEAEGLTPLTVQRKAADTHDTTDVESGTAPPTKRTPLLGKSKGGALPVEGRAVDARTLDAADFTRMPKAQRRAAIQRVLQADEDVDTDKFVETVSARLDVCGVKPQGVEIRFQKLNLSTTWLHAGKAKVGKRLIRTVQENKTIDNWAKKPLPETEYRTLNVLRDCSGVLRPGRMTLLAGPPGAGKSSLMRVLAGKFDVKGFETSGEVLFNNQLPGKDFALQSSTCYLEERDAHVPELTVRETLSLAAQGARVTSESGILREIRRKESELGLEKDPQLEAYVDVINADVAAKKSFQSLESKLYLYQLHKCADTVVGNELLRGLQGAQRKLLTVAEATAGPVRALFLDNSAAGLDADSEIEYMRVLKRAAKFLPLTVMMVNPQPCPEVYEMYDDVMVMGDGYVLYHGPREQALPFFASQGLKPAAGRDPVDFLNQLAVKDYQPMFSSDDSKYITPRELAEAFAASALGQQREADLTGDWVTASKSKYSGNLDLEPLVEHPYGGRQGVKACGMMLARREVLQLVREPMLVVTRWLTTFAVALMVGLTWLRSPATYEKGLNFAGLLFFSVVYMYLSHFAETSIFMRSLPTFFKQRDNRMYPAWMSALPGGLVYAGIVSFVDATIYTLPVYWISGLAGTFGHFIVFWMMLWWVGWLGILTFRIWAALGRGKMKLAQYLTALWMLLAITTAGYLVHRDKIRGWLIWFYWLNPLSWIWRAFMNNEFDAGRWAYKYPYPWFKHEVSDPAYSISTGEAVMQTFYVQYADWWIWVGGWVFVWGFIILHIVALGVALMYIKPMRKKPSLPSDLESQRDFERYAAIKENQAEQREASQSARSIGRQPSTSSTEAAAPAPAADTTGPATPSKMTNLLAAAKAKMPAAMASKLPDTAPTAADVKAMGGKMAAGGKKAVGKVKMPPSLKKKLAKKEKPDPFADLGTLAEAPVIPFLPVTYSFKHLALRVPKYGTKATEDDVLYLLRDVTGVFRPSTVTAIMGEIGAGKKLVMDVLAMQPTVPSSEREGELHVNGHPFEASAMQRVSGYVEQIDVLAPMMTVRETVAHAARTQLPGELSLSLVEKHVEQVMRTCDLVELADERIGVAYEKGLSVEQRRRVSIAAELAANPSLLFLEEPTARLDARDALIVMDLLRRVADSGRTVVCTLQQPRADEFAMCDDLLLMKPGGRPIYFGAIGEGSQYITEYFESIPGVQPLAPGDNPAKWMMEVSSTAREVELDADMYDVYKESELYRNILEVVDEQHKPGVGTYPLPPRRGRKTAINPAAQLAQLLRRNFAHGSRDAGYIGLRYAYTIVASVLLGLLWWNLGNNRNTPNGITQIYGATFTACLVIGIWNAVAAMQPTMMTRMVAARERGTSKGIAALAGCLSEGVWSLAQSIVFTLPWYWMLSMYADAGKFFWAVWFFWLTFWYWSLLGSGLANTFRSLPGATIALATVIASWVITAGYLIPRPQLPGWAVWYYWISPLAWSNYGLVGTQLGNIQRAYTFTNSGFVLSVGGFVLERYGLRHWMAEALASIMLWVAVLGFTLLNYGAMRFIDHERLYSYRLRAR